MRAASPAGHPAADAPPLGLSLAALRALAAPAGGTSPASLRASSEVPVAALSPRAAAERLALPAALPGGGSFAALLLREDEEFTRAGAQPRAAAATVVVAAADGCTLADVADALQALYGDGGPAVYACVPPLCFAADPNGASGIPPGDGDAHQLWLTEQLCAALRAVPTLVLVVPAARITSGDNVANAVLPLSSAPCVVAVAAVLRAGCEPRVARTPAAVVEARTALLSRVVTRPGDLLGDAAAAGRMVPIGAAADVAGWAATWLLRHGRVELAELQAAGKGASVEAAFCMANLGVAAVAAERQASSAERAEALGQLRTALCLFAQAPAPDAKDSQQRRDAVLACLDALPGALPAPERADGAAKAQPQRGAGAEVAKLVALALLVSLCADVATLVAALPWLCAALLRAGAAALRLATVAVLLLHAAHAAVALSEPPRLRPEPAKAADKLLAPVKAAEKVPRVAPGILKTPTAAEKVRSVPTPSTPSSPPPPTPASPSSPPAAASPLRSMPQIPQTPPVVQTPETPKSPKSPPRARFSDDVTTPPGAAQAAAVSASPGAAQAAAVSASSPGAQAAAAAFGVALKPALAARGAQAKRTADEAAKRAAAAEAAVTAARWAAAVRAATRPSPGPFIRTVVRL